MSLYKLKNGDMIDSSQAIREWSKGGTDLVAYRKYRLMPNGTHDTMICICEVDEKWTARTK